MSNSLYSNSLMPIYVDTLVRVLRERLRHFRSYIGYLYSYIFLNINKILNTIRFLKPFGIRNFNKFYSPNKFFRRIPSLLMMSFRRSRLFSSIQSKSSITHSNSSLGMFSVYLNRGKAFTKNKSNYILMSSFLRKLIVYSSLRDIFLIVKHIPIYLNELIATINKQSINFYKDPFSGKLISESGIKNSFYFDIFFFFNNKPYGFVKTRKKGRIKRKITKRLVKLNRLVD